MRFPIPTLMDLDPFRLNSTWFWGLQGAKVLCIDFDMQGHLFFGFTRDEAVSRQKEIQNQMKVICSLAAERALYDMPRATILLKNSIKT